MTHFRFRYKRVGFMRWRCRTASRRASVLAISLVTKEKHAPSMAAWRRTTPVVLPPLPVVKVLQVGDFIVGAEGDPNLSGHPDIRY